MHEDLDLTNYGLNPVRCSLEIASRSDFADIFEAKANKIVRRGQIETLWDAQRGALSNTYCNKDFFRSVTITACGGVPVYANGRMSFQIDLAPGVSWHCCLHYDLADGQDSVPAPVDCVEKGAEGRQADSLDQWRKQVLSIPPRTRSTTVFSTKRWKTWQLCGFHARATVPGSPCRRQGCLGSWRLSDATA